MDDDKNLNNPPAGNDGNGNPPAGNGGEWTAPEGFDAEMFDENHALKTESVKARFDADAAKVANLEKQVGDLRRKVSNKDALGSEEEYSKGYSNEDFKKIAAEDNERGKFLTGTLANLDKIAKENGLSLAQTNAVKEGLYGLMQDLRVIDNRTAEEKATAIADLQKSVLGDNAAELVKSNTEWIENYGLFSDAEKEMLGLACREGNPLINSVIHKFHGLFGKTSSADIPVKEGVNQDGLPTDAQLATEYASASPERRIEIIKQRAAAGRTGKLPISAK